MGADPAVAFRLATQHVAARDGTLASVAASWAVQDSPPGSAALAFAARVPELAPGDLDRALLEERTLVAVYNPRTATSIVPADDLPTFGAALDPGDDPPPALARALPEDGSMTAAEAFATGTAAVADALADGPLSRDELHEQLRRRLPSALLPWCPGCESHHARRGILVVAGLRGALCIAGRSGRQVRFARPDLWLGAAPARPAREEALRQLARRYLHGFAPSTPAHLAEWAGITRAHATAALAAAAGEVDGPVLRDDAALLAAPPRAPGVRLLPPGDPLLQARDRERLVADPATRKRLWTATGAAGLVLLDGEPAALWRARKQGRRLELTVTPFAGALPEGAIAAEAQRIAPLRGCTAATVALG